MDFHREGRGLALFPPFLPCPTAGCRGHSPDVRLTLSYTSAFRTPPLPGRPRGPFSTGLGCQPAADPSPAWGPQGAGLSDSLLGCQLRLGTLEGNSGLPEGAGGARGRKAPITGGRLYAKCSLCGRRRLQG